MSYHIRGLRGYWPPIGGDNVGQCRLLLIHKICFPTSEMFPCLSFFFQTIRFSPHRFSQTPHFSQFCVPSPRIPNSHMIPSLVDHKRKKEKIGEAALLQRFTVNTVLKYWCSWLSSNQLCRKYLSVSHWSIISVPDIIMYIFRGLQKLGAFFIHTYIYEMLVHCPAMSSTKLACLTHSPVFNMEGHCDIWLLEFYHWYTGKPSNFFDLCICHNLVLFLSRNCDNCNKPATLDLNEKTWHCQSMNCWKKKGSTCSPKVCFSNIIFEKLI